MMVLPPPAISAALAAYCIASIRNVVRVCSRSPTPVNAMSLEFIYTGPTSYRTYLAGLYLRDKIDVAIAKAVRAAVGSVAEVYGGMRAALGGAVRDLRFGGDGPCEVLTVNLTHACAAVDPVAADVVGGFQALFDDDAPPRAAED